MRAAWPWRWTARSCRAPNGTPLRCRRMRAWRCWERCREDDWGMDELASMQLTAAAGPVAAEGDTLTIAGRTMRSRLVLGSGGFPSLQLLSEAVAASGCELVTVALRRGLRRGDAARVADRQRHGRMQPLQHRFAARGRRRPCRARRRGRHGLGRGARDGAGLRWRDGGLGDRAGTGSGEDGGGDAGGR